MNQAKESFHSYEKCFIFTAGENKEHNFQEDMTDNKQ
jgi:hypothetical protein